MNESMAILRHPYFSEVHEKIGFEIEGIQVITECNRGKMTLTLRGESEVHLSTNFGHEISKNSQLHCKAV